MTVNKLYRHKIYHHETPILLGDVDIESLSIWQDFV